MRQFVTPGLLDDVSDLYVAGAKRVDSSFGARARQRRRRAQYGIPYTYYQIGLYYRRDLLAAAGIAEPPRHWDELRRRLRQAQGKGHRAVRDRHARPLALRRVVRLHRSATQRARVSHGPDARARSPTPIGGSCACSSTGETLSNMGCFAETMRRRAGRKARRWSTPGKAAMMLMGNFIVANFPPEMRDRMEFIPFPSMRRDFGRYEDAPDQHRCTSRRGRATRKTPGASSRYVLRADVQEALNKATLQTSGQSAHRGVASDRFIVQGRELLARADGLAQYFDRDTSEDLANIAMKGFQEFMLYPDRLDAILANIERARLRIYGPLPAPSRRRNRRRRQVGVARAPVNRIVVRTRRGLSTRRPARARVSPVSLFVVSPDPCEGSPCRSTSGTASVRRSCVGPRQLP